jgi:hypothetical protein
LSGTRTFPSNLKTLSLAIVFAQINPADAKSATTATRLVKEFHAVIQNKVCETSFFTRCFIAPVVSFFPSVRATEKKKSRTGVMEVSVLFVLSSWLSDSSTSLVCCILTKTLGGCVLLCVNLLDQIVEYVSMPSKEAQLTRMRLEDISAAFQAAFAPNPMALVEFLTGTLQRELSELQMAQKVRSFPFILSAMPCCLSGLAWARRSSIDLQILSDVV